MNKQEVYDFLSKNHIEHEITEHAAVYNMEELAQVQLPYPDRDAKNLFVRDDKRRNYYLITVRGDKRVNLKDFRRKQSTKPLTFASPEELEEILGLIPGAVTPLRPAERRRVPGAFLHRPGFLAGFRPDRGTSQRQHRHRLAESRRPGTAAAGPWNRRGHRGAGLIAKPCCIAGKE